MRAPLQFRCNSSKRKNHPNPPATKFGSLKCVRGYFGSPSNFLPATDVCSVPASESKASQAETPHSFPRSFLPQFVKMHCRPGNVAVIAILLLRCHLFRLRPEHRSLSVSLNTTVRQSSEASTLLYPTSPNDRVSPFIS